MVQEPKLAPESIIYRSIGYVVFGPSHFKGWHNYVATQLWGVQNRVDLLLDINRISFTPNKLPPPPPRQLSTRSLIVIVLVYESHGPLPSSMPSPLLRENNYVTSIQAKNIIVLLTAVRGNPR